MNLCNTKLLLIITIYTFGYMPAAAQTCEGATSEYTINPAATRDSNTISPRGGTYNLIYTLSSGTAVPGLGNSFRVPVTYSALNNVHGGTNNWQGFSVITMSGLNYAILLPVTNAAITGSIYHNLPAQNRQSETPTNPNSTDNFFTTRVAGGSVAALGTFDIDIGNYPVFPAGTTLISDMLVTRSIGNLSTNGTINQSGFWQKPTAQTAINTAAGANTAPFLISEGTTVPFRYAAFSNGSNYANNGGVRGVGLAGSVTLCYEAPLPVTFLSVHAEKQRNGNIEITWSTATEQNNAYFEIEMSKDGKTFSKTGPAVKTKATDGNSNTKLTYNVSIPPTQFAAIWLLLPLVIGSIVLPLQGKRKYSLHIIVTIIAFGIFCGCARNNDSVETGTNHSWLVRLKQVDKDGIFKYSKTVKVLSL